MNTFNFFFCLIVATATQNLSGADQNQLRHKSRHLLTRGEFARENSNAKQRNNSHENKHSSLLALKPLFQHGAERLIG